MDLENEILRPNEIDISNIIEQKTNQDIPLYTALLFKGNNTYIIHFNYYNDLMLGEYIIVRYKNIINEYKFKTYLNEYNTTDKIKCYNVYDLRYENKGE